MMALDADNPMPFLKTLLGKKVGVTFRWGNKYFGKLVNIDKHMNLTLEDFTVLKDGKISNNVLGIVLLRRANVLHIYEWPEENEEQECNSGKGADAPEM